jgi:hypothetical protein
MLVVLLARGRLIARLIPGAAILFSLAIVASSTSWVMQPPLSAIVMPEAHDVRVTTSGLGNWQITYRTSDAHFHWYVIAGSRLNAEGWALRERWMPENAVPPYHAVVPLRFDRLVWGVLREEVVLYPVLSEPMLARIRLQRRLDLTAVHALVCRAGTCD